MKSNTYKKIKNLGKFGIKPGLSRIKKLLKDFKNPQEKMNFIHVAGTNGKGSICNMLASSLSENGYKTGLFTSPFVIDFRESISINENKIKEEDLSRIYKIIKPNKKDPFTEFEIMTAIAFKWFFENKCDIVVLEAGLGGRLDSTNVIKNPLISVITSISYDHTDILGNTLKKIAKEKCGIIKNDCTTVVYPDQNYEVLDFIKKYCKNKKNILTIPNILDFNVIKEKISGTYLEIKEKNFFLPLPGIHQVKNLSTVLCILKILSKKGFFIDLEQALIGISKMFIPARLEIVKEKPLLILDGAHNQQSMSVLIDFLKKHIKNRKIFAIFSLLKTKEFNIYLKMLCKILDGFFVTRSSNNLSISPVFLSNFIKENGGKVLSIDESNKSSIEKALKFCRNDDVLLVFGSFYLIREIRPLLIKKRDESYGGKNKSRG